MTVLGFLFGKNDAELMEKQFGKDTKCSKNEKYYTRRQNKGENNEKIEILEKNKQKIEKVSTSRERATYVYGGVAGRTRAETKK